VLENENGVVACHEVIIAASDEESPRHFIHGFRGEAGNHKLERMKVNSLLEVRARPQANYFLVQILLSLGRCVSRSARQQLRDISILV